MGPDVAGSVKVARGSGYSRYETRSPAPRPTGSSGASPNAAGRDVPATTVPRVGARRHGWRKRTYTYALGQTKTQIFESNLHK